MKKIVTLILTASLLCTVLCAAAAALTGDVNSDGQLNNKDVVALFRYVSGNKDAVKDVSACDFNGDGEVDNKDVVAMFKAVSTSDKKYEEAVLYPCNDVVNTLSAEQINKIEYFWITAGGRNTRHICPGESFQYLVYAGNREEKYDPLNLSVKDVELKVTEGASHCRLTSNGVFTALSAGEVTVEATLKADRSITYTSKITIKDPEKLNVNYWKGSGTYFDPYIISTAEDFLNIAKICTFEYYNNDYQKGGHWFRQTADIDLSGIDYEPPMYMLYNYDGGGHKISNVTVDSTCTETALFSIMMCRVIRDLTVENYTYKRNNTIEVGNTGVFAALAFSGEFLNCRAENIDIDISNNKEYSGWVGGFVCHCAESTYFANCSVSGKIKCDDQAGGFICFTESTAYNSLFSNCAANVTVDGVGNEIGGFSSKKLPGSYLYNCTSTQYDKTLEEKNIVTE